MVSQEYIALGFPHISLGGRVSVSLHPLQFMFNYSYVFPKEHVCLKIHQIPLCQLNLSLITNSMQIIAS